MTVRYLRSVQQTRQFYNPVSYRQGFGECKEQVLKLLVNCPDLPASSKGKILTQVSSSLVDHTQQLPANLSTQNSTNLPNPTQNLSSPALGNQNSQNPVQIQNQQNQNQPIQALQSPSTQNSNVQNSNSTIQTTVNNSTLSNPGQTNLMSPNGQISMPGLVQNQMAQNQLAQNHLAQAQLAQSQLAQNQLLAHTQLTQTQLLGLASPTSLLNLQYQTNLNNLLKLQQQAALISGQNSQNLQNGQNIQSSQNLQIGQNLVEKSLSDTTTTTPCRKRRLSCEPVNNQQNLIQLNQNNLQHSQNPQNNQSPQNQSTNAACSSSVMSSSPDSTTNFTPSPKRPKLMSSDTTTNQAQLLSQLAANLKTAQSLQSRIVDQGEEDEEVDILSEENTTTNSANSSTDKLDMSNEKEEVKEVSGGVGKTWRPW